MIRKIISSFISLFVLLSVIVVSALLLARNFLSGPNLVNILTGQLEEENINITEVITEEYEGLEDYIDKEELKKELGNIMEDYLKYSSGVPNAKKPSIDEMRVLINKYCDKYEEATGKTIDKEKINESLESFEESINDEVKKENIDPNVSKVFKIIYSNSVLAIFIVTIIVGLILILIISKAIKALFIHAAIISILNSGLIGGIGDALKKLNTSTESIDLAMIDNLVSSFKQVALVSLVIGIILIVIVVIIHLIKSSTNKSEPTSLKQDNTNDYYDESYQNDIENELIDKDNKNQ